MAQRGRPFQPGNKFGRGRPPGSQNKKTVLIDEFLAQKSQPLLHKAFKLAHQGNERMLRLLLDRILPRPKDAAVTIGPLLMDTPEQLLEAQAKVMQELALGKITPNQAEQICSLMEIHRCHLKSEVRERQLRAKEQRSTLGVNPSVSSWR